MLSILTRVGLEANPVLFDLTLCLAAQSDTDFEWIILARPNFSSVLSQFHQILTPHANLNARTRIVNCASDNRSTLLNIGLSEAKGDYLVVLDDDDLVTSDFVEIFNNAAIEYAGLGLQPALRTLPSSKIVEHSSVKNRELIGKSRINFPWPDFFDPSEHLKKNSTPCCAIAWPIDAIKSNEILWDETLDRCEDWDFLLQMILHAGVIQIPTPTSIYRLFESGSRSTLNSSSGQWKESEKIIRAKVKTRNYVFAPVPDLLFFRNLSYKIEAVIFSKLHILRKSNTLYRISRYIYRKFFKNLES